MAVIDLVKRLRLHRINLAKVKSYELEISQYEAILNDENIELYGFYAKSVELGMPKSAMNQSSPVENEVIQIDNEREMSRQLIKQWIVDAKSRMYWLDFEAKQIITSMNGLDYRQRFLIEMRYFERLDWESVRLSYNEQFRRNGNLITSEERIKQLVSEALKEIRPSLRAFYGKHDWVSDYQ